MDWLDLAEQFAPAPFYWAISVAQTFHITVYDLRIFVLLICLTLIAAVNYWLPTGVYLISNTCITFFISIAWLWTFCSNFFVQLLRHFRLNDCWNCLVRIVMIFWAAFHDLLIYWIIWGILLAVFFKYIFSITDFRQMGMISIFSNISEIFMVLFPNYLFVKRKLKILFICFPILKNSILL